jgi:hypothetical protein
MFFGVRYLAIASELGFFSVAMGCIALSTVLINYFIAIRNTSFLYFLGFGILLEVLFIVFNHSSLRSITNMLVISSTIILFFLGINYLIIYKFLKYEK